MSSVPNEFSVIQEPPSLMIDIAQRRLALEDFEEVPESDHEDDGAMDEGRQEKILEEVERLLKLCKNNPAHGNWALLSKTLRLQCTSGIGVVRPSGNRNPPVQKKLFELEPTQLVESYIEAGKEAESSKAGSVKRKRLTKGNKAASQAPLAFPVFKSANTGSTGGKMIYDVHNDEYTAPSFDVLGTSTPPQKVKASRKPPPIPKVALPSLPFTDATTTAPQRRKGKSPMMDIVPPTSSVEDTTSSQEDEEMIRSAMYSTQPISDDERPVGVAPLVSTQPLSDSEPSQITRPKSPNQRLTRSQVPKTGFLPLPLRGLGSSQSGPSDQQIYAEDSVDCGYCSQVDVNGTVEHVAEFLHKDVEIHASS